MICFPNAKINLGLYIVDKRDDGYHNIQTTMIPVPVYDIIEIRKAKKFAIHQFGVEDAIPTEDNIIFKAWLAIKNHIPSIDPLEVNLYKNIPVGAGLGGGSSDASHFLTMVNSFYKLGLGLDDMMKLIAKVGSDCPFFIRNKAMFVEGKGDILREVANPLLGYNVLIIYPGINISTREAYSKLDISKNITHSQCANSDIYSWREQLKNDFEPGIFSKYPLLKQIKHQLYNNGALYASMTGSGSAIYGISTEIMDIKSNFPDLRTFQFIIN